MEDRSRKKLTPVRVDDRRTIDEICLFRARVWQATEGVSTQAFPAEGWRDEHDAGALHWVVYNELGSLVAAARLRIHACWDDLLEAYQYRRYGLASDGLIAAPDRIVVCPQEQQRGIASELLAVQDQAAVSAGATLAVRQASPRMTSLLLRRGWRLCGPALPDARFPGVEFTVAVKDYRVAAERKPGHNFSRKAV